MSFVSKLYCHTFNKSSHYRIPSTTISTESLSIELIASLLKSVIPQKNDMKFETDQTLFLKKVILTRELLLEQVHFYNNGSLITTFNDYVRKQIKSNCEHRASLLSAILIC